MKRRILIEVDVNDDTKGCMLDVLNKIDEALSNLQSLERLYKYGIDLISPAVSVDPIHVIPIETMEIPEE